MADPVAIGKRAIELAEMASKNTKGVTFDEPSRLLRITSVPKIKVGI